MQILPCTRPHPDIRQGQLSKLEGSGLLWVGVATRKQHLYRNATSDFGIAAITVAVFSPGIGMLLDRFPPPRRIILPSILVFGFAYISLSSLMPNITRFHRTYFVLGVVGNGTAQLSYTRDGWKDPLSQ